MSKESEAIGNIIQAYFDTDKSLKDIFEEYTVDFSEEEKQAFYKNLKIIAS